MLLSIRPKRELTKIAIGIHTTDVPSSPTNPMHKEQEDGASGLSSHGPRCCDEEQTFNEVTSTVVEMRPRGYSGGGAASELNEGTSAKEHGSEPDAFLKNTKGDNKINPSSRVDSDAVEANTDMTCLEAWKR
ncbi:hypothetical protein FRB95_010014 [Tulasnella sp. JGI-2019a]|nr:hypothetical protein FRB95_010014 [Tulasnella sp. JGI-2019a]